MKKEELEKGKIALFVLVLMAVTLSTNEWMGRLGIFGSGATARQRAPNLIQAPVPDGSFDKTLYARADHQWVGIDIPDGCVMVDDWGSAPIDIRVYRGTNRNAPPEEYILPTPQQDRGAGVWRKEYRLHLGSSGYAEIKCHFQKQ